MTRRRDTAKSYRRVPAHLAADPGGWGSAASAWAGVGNPAVPWSPARRGIVTGDRV